MNLLCLRVGDQTPFPLLLNRLTARLHWRLSPIVVSDGAQATPELIHRVMQGVTPDLVIAPLTPGMAPALRRLGAPFALALAADASPTLIEEARASDPALVLLDASRDDAGWAALFPQKLELGFDGVNPFEFGPYAKNVLQRDEGSTLSRAEAIFAVLGAVDPGAPLHQALRRVQAQTPFLRLLTMGPTPPGLRGLQAPENPLCLPSMFLSARVVILAPDAATRAAAAQAMSCGAMVVAPIGSDAATMFRHQTTGLALDFADAEQVHAALARLAADPALCLRFGEFALGEARARHWSDVVHDDLERSLIDVAVGARGGVGFISCESWVRAPAQEQRAHLESALHQQRWAGALAIARAALRGGALLGWAHYGRAVALAGLGAADLAEQALARALALDPQDPRSQQAALRLLNALNRPHEAAHVAAELGQPSKAYRCATTPFDLANQLLTGLGVEIGPMDTPFLLNAKTVKVDVKSQAELRALAAAAQVYGGTDPARIAPVQARAADGDRLPFFCDDSFDFVCNSHVLEHLANPGRAIQEWLRIIRPGGRVFIVAPDKRDCYDRHRADTPVEHLMDEFRRDERRITLEHYQDAMTLKEETSDTGPVDRRPEAIQALYDAQAGHEHVHVFTDASLKAFLVALQAEIGGFELSYLRRFGLHIVVLLTKTAPTATSAA